MMSEKILVELQAVDPNAAIESLVNAVMKLSEISNSKQMQHLQYALTHAAYEAGRIHAEKLVAEERAKYDEETFAHREKVTRKHSAWRQREIRKEDRLPINRAKKSLAQLLGMDINDIALMTNQWCMAHKKPRKECGC